MRLAALATAAALSLTAAASASSCTDGEVPYVRTYFYAGGQYVDDGNGGKIFRDQMYVEKLVPARGVTRTTPVVLIHGQAQTGTNFLNKPDGGRGWASQFIRQGYEVYIVDQTLRARSAWQPGYGAEAPSTYSAELLQQRFTAVQNYKLWPQSVNHTQWPGSGVMGDPVFDAFYASNVQFLNNATLQQSTMAAAGAALLDRIGRPAVLVGHSQGGVLPLLIADARPALAAALVLLEPTGPPFREAIFSDRAARPYGLTDAPLAYDPPVTDPAADLVQQVYPARDDGRGVPGATVECVLQAESPTPRRLANLVDKNILIMTGEASYHMPYDYCTADYLKQAGCAKTEHLKLGGKGIHGNGHMFFMERNSNRIQAVLHDWIQRLE